MPILPAKYPRSRFSSQRGHKPLHQRRERRWVVRRDSRSRWFDLDHLCHQPRCFADIQTLEPRKDWSSRAIASSIFGSDACRGFDGYVQSHMRQGRTSAHIQSSSGAVVVDRMNIDIEHSTEWIPSHVLDDLHLQLVDHFTILLKELVERIDPEAARSAGKNAASLSMHAGVLTKPFEEWTAADCLERLGTLRNLPGSRALRLGSFMSKPHCKDANAWGRRRGQDWTRVQWDTAMQMLGGVGKCFEDQAIGESVDLLKIAVEDYFRLPT